MTEYYVELLSAVNGKWHPCDDRWLSLEEAEADRDRRLGDFRAAGYGFWTAARLCQKVTTVVDDSKREV